MGDFINFTDFPNDFGQVADHTSLKHVFSLPGMKLLFFFTDWDSYCAKNLNFSVLWEMDLHVIADIQYYQIFDEI